MQLKSCEKLFFEFRVAIGNGNRTTREKIEDGPIFIFLSLFYLLYWYDQVFSIAMVTLDSYQ